MKYVGIDLHKKTIVICVVDKGRKVLERIKFLCVDSTGIAALAVWADHSLQLLLDSFFQQTSGFPLGFGAGIVLDDCL
jgi:hypothetical protein